MCNLFNGNSCTWVLILVVLLLLCNCGGNDNRCGCGNDCVANNGCC